MTNCEWFNSKLEAYFCDDLAGGELQRFQAHMESCAECREQVESLKSIDPLVRGVLHHRLALARMAVRSNGHTRTLKLALNGRTRILRLAMTTGTLAAATVLLVVGMRFFQEVPPVPPLAIQPPGVETPLEPVKEDFDPQANPRLAKPEDGTPVRPVPQPHLDNALVNGPEFAITDATGYTATLETYRGRVVLFAVVSPHQKAAVGNLDQIYEAFGLNPGIAILAVARHREDEFRDIKFPLFFNNGSRLLGVQEGQFMLVDAAGKTRLEGSLADPSNGARIRSELGQLGIRQ